jgi:hypothetical protein
MFPSELIDAQRYPSLKQLLEIQLDMQFVDLRTLLRLPRSDDGLNGGCNLTAASLLFSIVAGSSVLFYDASTTAMADGRQSGRRFKELLARYYPFGDDDLPREEAARVLYESARNPLTHCFGVGKDKRVFPGAPQVGNRPLAVIFMKGPLGEEEVNELANARGRPDWTQPTVAVEQDECLVSVWTLSWGVHEMLRRLFDDGQQAQQSDATAARLLTPRTP